MTSPFITITITNDNELTNDTFENIVKIDSVECTQKVEIEKQGRVLNCHVTFYNLNGTKLYEYESLDFGKYLDQVKSLSLDILKSRIVDKAKELMAA